jgi:ubiquinone/menaquinone biosynthesis C-methylase UbiE
VKIYRAGQLAAQRFVLSIERPANDETAYGDIEVRGWCVSLDGQAVSGRVVINNQTAAELAIEQHRPDVGFVYDLPPNNPPVGFEHKFAWDELGDNETQAKVSIELVHGGDLVVLGPYTITRSSAPILRHQRGSYQEVWDGAASDPVSAMACVAGTSDLDEFMQSGASTALTIREALQVSESDVVLEIGCGVGRVGYFLAPICRKWIGADISSNMLKYAAENLRKFENIELVSLTSSNLRKFSDGSTDKIYCSTVFMHLDEWDRFRYVQEAWRVLRSGGACFFDNINLAGELGWAVFEDVLAIDPARRCAAVSKPSTGEELSTYLRMAGFSDIEIRPTPHYVSVIGIKP